MQSSLIPVLQFSTNLGITGSFPAVWLAHTGFGLPFAIFLLRNFFGQLPKEMFESAYLDGASPTHRVLPAGAAPVGARHRVAGHLPVHVRLERPAGGADPSGRHADVAPMTVTIANLVNSLGQGYHLLTAAAFISMILPLVVFFSLQRYFVRGILGGSVKG